MMQRYLVPVNVLLDDDEMEAQVADFGVVNCGEGLLVLVVGW